MTASAKSLWVACAWSVTAAMAGRSGGLLPACSVALLALAATLWLGRAGPWIWAWPAAFAAGIPPAPVLPPRPGPVHVAGRVLGPVHFDPVERLCSCQVQHHGQVFGCLVLDTDRDSVVLPGDQVQGPAHYAARPMRRRRGGIPQVRTTRDALRVSPPGPGTWTLPRFATACRLGMQGALLDAVPGEAGRLLCLLTLGSGPRLAHDLPAAHRATGLSHLLAVSGAHLTMLGWMLGALAFACTRRAPLASPWFRRCCLGVLIVYGAITGLDPPIFRAVVAATVFFLGVSAQRRVPAAAVLCLPAILTAVLLPEDLFSVSFNLSYAAVIGLFLSQGFARGSSYQRWVRGPFLCSVWATLCTMPITLWYFGRIAPWTILATPVLSPWIACMLALALLVATCSSVLPGLVTTLSLPLTLLTELYCAAIRGLSHLPFAPVYASTRPDPLLLLCAALLGALALLYWRDRRGVAALCVLLSCPHFTTNPTPGSAPRMTLLAVGHGHAALLHLPGGARILVDCGTLGSCAAVARHVSAHTLPRRDLDWLIVTHGDHDHIGCIPALLDRVLIHHALLPLEMRSSEVAEHLARQGCGVQFLAAGQRRQITDALLVHRPCEQGDRNDQSAWIHADYGSFRAILPGDAMQAGVTAWLASDLAEPAQVLVLPHHGRPHGAIEALLQAVRPAVALVSCRDSDGVSAQGAIARAAGCQVLHTGLVGHIQVRDTSPPTLHTEFPMPLPQRRK